MRPLTLTTIALALAAGCAPEPSVGPSRDGSLSLAVANLNERIPVSFVVANPCPPVAENIAFDGWLHLQANARSTPSAAATVHVNLVDIHGVGQTSGLAYNGNATGHADATVTFPPFVLDAEIPVHAYVASQGSNANVAVNLVLLLHREPAGNVLVTGVGSIETVCQ